MWHNSLVTTGMEYHDVSTASLELFYSTWVGHYLTGALYLEGFQFTCQRVEKGSKQILIQGNTSHVQMDWPTPYKLHRSFTQFSLPNLRLGRHEILITNSKWLLRADDKIRAHINCMMSCFRRITKRFIRMPEIGLFKIKGIVDRWCGKLICVVSDCLHIHGSKILIKWNSCDKSDKVLDSRFNYSFK